MKIEGYTSVFNRPSRGDTATPRLFSTLRKEGEKANPNIYTIPSLSNISKRFSI